MADEVTTETLEQAILESATEGVSSVTVDGMTVTEQRLADRIKVLERRISSEAASKPHFGLRFTQLVPPGCG